MICSYFYFSYLTKKLSNLFCDAPLGSVVNALNLIKLSEFEIATVTKSVVRQLRRITREQRRTTRRAVNEQRLDAAITGTQFRTINYGNRAAA